MLLYTVFQWSSTNSSFALYATCFYSQPKWLIWMGVWTHVVWEWHRLLPKHENSCFGCICVYLCGLRRQELHKHSSISWVSIHSQANVSQYVSFSVNVSRNFQEFLTILGGKNPPRIRVNTARNSVKICQNYWWAQLISNTRLINYDPAGYLVKYSRNTWLTPDGFISWHPRWYKNTNFVKCPIHHLHRPCLHSTSNSAQMSQFISDETFYREFQWSCESTGCNIATMQQLTLDVLFPNFTHSLLCTYFFIHQPSLNGWKAPDIHIWSQAKYCHSFNLKHIKSGGSSTKKKQPVDCGEPL